MKNFSIIISILALVISITTLSRNIFYHYGKDSRTSNQVSYISDQHDPYEHIKKTTSKSSQDKLQQLREEYFAVHCYVEETEKPHQIKLIIKGLDPDPNKYYYVYSDYSDGVHASTGSTQNGEQLETIFSILFDEPKYIYKAFYVMEKETNKCIYVGTLRYDFKGVD